MIKYVLLPLKLIIYNISRKINRTLIYPVNYTYSITSLCDSKCKTCNIWKKRKNEQKKELTTKEWMKIIKDIGNKPIWITLTGGNQFLRKDFTDIILQIKKYNNPEIINIPVSGTMPKLIGEKIENIMHFMGNTKIILNISLDGTEKIHNLIRGKKNAFENTFNTIKILKKIQKKYSNLIIGTYTTISKYNIDNIKELYQFIKSDIEPDNVGFEIAEKRKEYNNINCLFTADEKKSSKIMRIIAIDQDNNKKDNIIIEIKNIIRKKYYRYISEIIIKKKEIFPCYAGIASVEISPSGELWECSNNARSMGNLTKTNFKIIFFGERAKKIRKKIKNKKCFCMHSNPFYINYLCKFRIFKK